MDELNKDNVESIEYKSSINKVELTEAQKKFMQTTHNRLVENFDNKKELSYKDRLSQFNRKLDTLSEHFDIQKVSWTK